MNREDRPMLPALPDDVAELVASARPIEGPSDDVRARLRARLIPPLPPPTGGDGGAPTPRPARLFARFGRAPWWAVAAAFVVGVGIGRGRGTPTPSGVASSAMRVEMQPLGSEAPPEALEARAPATDFLDHAPAPEAPPKPRTTSAAVSVSVPFPVSSSASSSASSSVSSATRSSDLPVERRLLAVARTALARAASVDALAACDEHARRFPRGALAEEREALAIEALADAKRSDEAKARAERFERAYPKSILLPAVHAAIDSEPR
jgi:hypothetical protein